MLRVGICSLMNVIPVVETIFGAAYAVQQNIGTTITAMLPALFVAVAPPGASNIPLTVGAITLAITVVVAITALTARETFRVRLADLGNKQARPVDKDEYDRLRAQAIAGASGVSAKA